MSKIHLLSGEAPAIHTLMNELEPEMAVQDSDEVYLLIMIISSSFSALLCIMLTFVQSRVSCLRILNSSYF